VREIRDGAKGFDGCMSLIDILRRCRDLTKASEHRGWSSATISEIVAVLDRAIVAIQCGAQPNSDELKLLFAPTGDLQETSIANGWDEEYLILAARFDALME